MAGKKKEWPNRVCGYRWQGCYRSEGCMFVGIAADMEEWQKRIDEALFCEDRTMQTANGWERAADVEGQLSNPAA